MSIPDFQKMPPAGFEKELAYRPACSQIVPSGDGIQTDYNVTRGDGVTIILATLPTQPIAQAHKTLNDWGLCKSNGAIVPIVAPGEAHTVISDRPTVNNLPIQPTSLPIVSIALGSLAVVAIALYALSQRQPDPQFKQLMGGDHAP